MYSAKRAFRGEGGVRVRDAPGRGSFALQTHKAHMCSVEIHAYRRCVRALFFLVYVVRKGCANFYTGLGTFPFD